MSASIPSSTATIVQSVCIVCNVEFESESNKNAKYLHNLLQDIWTVFSKYLDLPPTIGTDILTFYKRFYELPFCLQCRNVLADLFLCHQKLQSVKNKIKGITANLSATIIQTFTHQVWSDDENSNINSPVTKEDLKFDVDEDILCVDIDDGPENFSSNSNSSQMPKIIKNEKINRQVHEIRREIVQRFSPEIQLTRHPGADEQVQVLFQSNELWNNILQQNANTSDSGETEVEEECISVEDDETPLQIHEPQQSPDPDENSKYPVDEKDDEVIVIDDSESEDDSPKRSSYQLRIRAATKSGGNGVMAAEDEVESIISERGSQSGSSSSGGSGTKNTGGKRIVHNGKDPLPVVRLGENRFQYCGWNFSGHSDTGFTCQCSEFRTELSALLRHVKYAHFAIKSKHLGEGKYSVTHTTGENFFYDLGEHAGFKCAQCGQVTMHKYSMTSHIKTKHGEPDAFHTCKWPGCNQTFSSPFNARRHYSVVHLKEKPATKKKKVNHSKTFNSSKRLRCKHCNTANFFKSKKNLTMHIKRFHDNNNLLSTAGKPKEPGVVYLDDDDDNANHHDNDTSDMDMNVNMGMETFDFPQVDQVFSLSSSGSGSILPNNEQWDNEKYDQNDDDEDNQLDESNSTEMTIKIDPFQTEPLEFDEESAREAARQFLFYNNEEPE